MRFAFTQIVGINIDDIAADRLGRVQGQRQIFVHRVDRQIFHIDGSFVDCIRARMIDDFATQQDKIGENVKKTPKIKTGMRHINLFLSCFFTIVECRP